MNENKSNRKVSFLSDLAAGYAIGIAFIIPGFSGGSVAAILGVYERLVGAIADLFHSFRESIRTLIPIGLGLCLGALSLLYPLSAALDFAPIPTVALFVGLAIGGIPSVTEKIERRGIGYGVLFGTLACLLALSLSFLPIGAERDLFSLDFFGYVLLFFVGAIGSSALVVPGISGSMLLLILGYYNPIVSVFTDNLLMGKNIAEAILILAVTALGIAVGFFGISKLMKLLLSRFPSVTYSAIVGFIIGSLPTVFISSAKEAGYTLNTLPKSPAHYIISALLLLLGGAVSLGFIYLARKKTK